MPCHLRPVYNLAMRTRICSEYSKRILIVDVLRGLCLFGILCAHSATQFFGMIPLSKEPHLVHGLFDRGLLYVISLFLTGKLFCIFSFLFGMSFYLSTRGTNNKDILYLKRILVLAVIGIFNYAFFQGDILLPFAILSVFLFSLRKLDNRSLYTLIIFLLSGLPRFILFSFSKLADGSVISMGKNLQERSFEVFKHSHFFDLVTFNLKNWPEVVKVYQLGLFGRGYQILAFFLIGLIVGRSGYFENLENNISATKKSINVLFFLSLGCAGLLVFVMHDQSFLEFNTWTAMIGLTLYDWFNLSFSGLIFAGYICFYMKLQEGHITSMLGDVGRMGLTVYLSQNLFFTWAYYGWGLQLFGKFGVSFSLFLGMLFFIVQLFFARWWFVRFKIGPVEWIWKSATFAKILPLKIPKIS